MNSSDSHAPSLQMDLALDVGDVDGFSRYGILDEIPDGLLCHDCGWIGAHLGLHAYRAHQETADLYRARHGLLRDRGLVSTPVRAVIRSNAQAGFKLRRAFVNARDPQRATRVRLDLNRTATPQEVAGRDVRMSQLGRRSRLGTVITCGWCQVQFCPLFSAKRRMFCSRSCASKANRAHAFARRTGGEK